MRRRRQINYNSNEPYDKTQFVEKELIDKISLWTLRVIFRLGASRKFLNNNDCFDSDSLACFLDLEKFVDMDSDDFKRREVFAILKKNHTKLEKRKQFTSSKILTKNIVNRGVKLGSFS